MLVQKFGGTSIEDAAAVERVCEIVTAARERCPVVVVSAIGETTDHLVEALERASLGEEPRALTLLSRLRRGTEGLVRDFFGGGAAAVEAEIAPLFDELWRMAGEVAAARIVARALAARGLPSIGVDSREILITDDRFGRAQPDLEETERRVRDGVRTLCVRGEIPVAAGYIGSNHAGATTTRGRGGSDYTAALLAAALDAEAVEIWTDVDGMMTADPRIVPEARPIETISFDEASELAYFGARVLHPLTLAPAIEKGIPVRIKNSRRPDFAGTEIRDA